MKVRTFQGRRGLAIAAIGFVSLLFLLLLAPVQSSLLRWATGAMEGVTLDFDSIHIAPWGASTQNLELRTPAFELRAIEARVKVDLWHSLRGLQLDIQSVSASGIDVLLKHTEPPDKPEPATPPQAFDGLSPLLRWPTWLHLQSLNANGTLSTEAGAPKQLTGPWRLDMSAWSRNSEGTLRFHTELDLSRAGETLGQLTADADAIAQIADDGTMADVSASVLIAPASGEEEQQLSAKLELKLRPERETGQLAVNSSNEGSIAQLNAAYHRDERRVGANWQADFGPGVLAAFLRKELDLDLTAASSGSADIDLVQPLVLLDTTVNAEGRGWEHLDSRLASLDSVSMSGEARLSGWGDQWSAQQFEALIHLPEQSEALRMTLLQATGIDLDKLTLQPEHWNEPALRLSASAAPLAWLRAFDPADVFRGGTLDGSLEVIPVAHHHLRLQASEPVHARALKLKPKNEQRLPEFDLELTPHVELKNGTLIAQIANTILSAPTGLSVKFNGQASSSRHSWPLIDFAGGISVRAPFLQKRVRELHDIRGVTELQLDLGELSVGVEAAALAARSTSEDILMFLKLEGDAPLLLTLPRLTPNWDNYHPQELSLTFDGLPIEWLSPYLPEIELRAGAVYGELLAVAAPGAGITLQTNEPFEIRNAQPYYRGQRIARSVSLSTSPRVQLTSQSAKLKLERISLRTLGKDRLDGEISLDWQRDKPGKIAMNLGFEGFFPSVTERSGNLGELRWEQQGGFDLDKGQFKIDHLAMSFTDMAGTRFMQLNSLRPFGIANEPFGFVAEGGPANVFKATLRPLELQRLVPKLWNFDLAGLLPEGEFYGYVDRHRRLIVRADEPLIFDDVTLRWKEAALVEKITVGLSYEVAYSIDGLEARQIEMKAFDSAGGSLAEVSLKAVAPLTEYQTLRSLDLDVETELAALAGQPVFDGMQVFERGKLRGKLKFLNQQAPLIRANVKLEGASTAESGQLPDVDVSFRADGERGERWAVELPIRMRSRLGRSDLDFTGEAVKRGADYRFDASLNGKQFIVPDLRRLKQLVVAAEENDRPQSDNGQRPGDRSALAQLKQQRDARPFWGDRLRGKASVDLGSLQLEKLAVNGIKGQLQVLPSTITLHSVRASLLEGKLASSGTINYRKEREIPYDLDFRLRVHDLQVAGLLPPSGPDESPLVEGLFSLSSELKSTGRNALDLAVGTYGDIDLNGRNGVFRGLAGRGGTASKAAKVSGALTFSSELKAIGRILDDLQEIRFSQLKLSLLRESKNRLKLDQFSVVSPLLRVDGQGTLAATPGQPLNQGPMHASLQLSTRSDMSILFDGMGLLEQGAGTAGYRSMKQPIDIDGTLAEPDTSALWELLDEAADNSGGSFGLGMKTINRKLKKSQSAAVR